MQSRLAAKIVKDLTSIRIAPSTRKLKKWKRVTTLAKEAVTKIDNNEDCKAIFTNDGAPLYTPFYYSLKEIKYFSANSRFSDDDELNNVTSIPDKDLKQTSPKQTTTHYIEPYIPPIPFPRKLKQHDKEALIHKTMESLKKLSRIDLSSRKLGNPTRFEKYGHHATHQTKSVTEEVFAIMKSNVTGKGTSDDEDDIERIIDYHEPTSYDGFIDLDEEEYNKRRCRLLGMP
ncbi:hypothetical protein Tco_1569566 [Tanacetum coccineum]